MLLRRFTEAAEVALDAAPGSPFELVFFSMALHALSRSRGDQAAIALYLERKDDIDRAEKKAGDGPPAANAWLRANLTWCALKTGDRSLDHLIEDFSNSAKTTASEVPEIKGTRGAWLIVTGEVDVGLPLLTEAVRSITDPIDRADFCLFLARGWRTQGDEERASAFEELRGHLLAAA